MNGTVERCFLDENWFYKIPRPIFFFHIFESWYINSIWPNWLWPPYGAYLLSCDFLCTPNSVWIRNNLVDTVKIDLGVNHTQHVYNFGNFRCFNICMPFFVLYQFFGQTWFLMTKLLSKHCDRRCNHETLILVTHPLPK